MVFVKISPVATQGGLGCSEKFREGLEERWESSINISQDFAYAGGPLAVGLLVFRSLVFVFLNASTCAGSLVSGCCFQVFF